MKKLINFYYPNSAVSAVTCYEGFGLRTQLTDNSIINLCQGELLVLLCITTSDIYDKLHLVGCATANGLPVPALNATGFCNITTNYTSIEVHGIFLNNSTFNSDELFEFDVETHNLEQCLALANARETPSLCTTPPPIDDPETNTSTSSTISITETNTSTIADNCDPTETADPGINNPGKFQQNDTTDVESEEITLYTAVCVLVVIAAVQLLVIVVLAVKLCCRGRRVKVAEDGGMYTGKQQEMSKISQQSLSSVITNTGSKDVETSMDVSREKDEEGEGGGATDSDQQVENISRLTSDKDKGGGGETGTDQQREKMGKNSRLTSDKGKGAVIANQASVDVEIITNSSKEVATVTKKEDKEEEHNQQNSDTAKETVIANEGTCSTEAKERIANGGTHSTEPAVGAEEKGITHGSSMDSVNDLTLTTIN
jgi:hypothetical protein